MDFDAYRSQYEVGNFEIILDTFHALSSASRASLTAPTLQIVAQSHARCGQYAEAAILFTQASDKYESVDWVNRGICVDNAFSLYVQSRCTDAALWLVVREIANRPSVALRAETVWKACELANSKAHSWLAGALMVLASRWELMRHEALRHVMIACLQHPEKLLIPAEFQRCRSKPDESQSVCFVTCSHIDERFREFVNLLSSRVNLTDASIVRVNNAHSMAEGYERAMAATQADILVFCHDDVEFLNDDLLSELRAAMQNVDIAVCVGATQLVGASWAASAPGTLRGWLAEPTPDGRYLVSMAGVPLRSEVAAIGDGFAIIARAEAARKIGWDAATFDGFHAYDSNFCAAATVAGYRLGFAPGVAVTHRSGGDFSKEWDQYAHRFCRKFGLEFRHTQPIDQIWAASVVFDHAREAGELMRNLSRLLAQDWLECLRLAEVSLHDALPPALRRRLTRNVEIE